MAEPPVLPSQRVFYGIASAALVIACLMLAQKVLIPLALAFLLTFILSPLVVALQRRGVNRAVSVGMVLLIAFLVLGGVGWLVAGQVRTLAAELASPQKQKLIANKIIRIQGNGQGFLNGFNQLYSGVRERLKEEERSKTDSAPSNSDQPVQPVVAPVQPDIAPFGYVTVMAAPLFEALASTFFVTVLIIFMLSLREDLRGRLLRLMGRGRMTSTTKAIDDAGQRISRFLLMQSLINVVFGTLFSAGLYFIGVPYALLWGFIAVVMRFIPYLGTWVALALPLVYTLALTEGWYDSLATAGVYMVLEVITANVIEPLVLGHSTGVSPLALLVAAAFWTWVWGPIGLIMSTPLTTCLVVLGKYIPHLEFLDIVLGSAPPRQTDVMYYQRLLANDEDDATDLVEDYLEDHPFETLFDEVLLPALIYAKTDFGRGELTQENMDFILREIRNLLSNYGTGTATAPHGPAKEQQVVILGCPAHDEVDEVALEMLHHVLSSSGRSMEVLSAQMLSSEIVSRVKEDGRALVCIAALPPGGLAQTRYLCKRLRAQVPNLKFVVCRWGQKDGIEAVRQRLTAAGADVVATSLLDARAQILGLVPVVAAQPDKTSGLNAPAIRESAPAAS